MPKVCHSCGKGPSFGQSRFVRDSWTEPGFEFESSFGPEPLRQGLAFGLGHEPVAVRVGRKVIDQCVNPSPVRGLEPRSRVPVDDVDGERSGLREQRGPLERALATSDDQTPATRDAARSTHSLV